MMRFIRDLRLIPIALIASACLLALKTADIVLDSSYFAGGDVPPRDSDVSVVRPMPDATAPPGSPSSWAQQMFNFPDGNGTAAVPERPKILPQLAAADPGDITGSVATTPAPGKDGKPAVMPSGAVIPTDGTALPTGAERAILERLQERREELDTRARELDIRESLIQGAEKRMDSKLAELKDTEDRIKVETQQKDDAEAARLKGLVIMYENMKPRDAAKIFNGLDPNVLIEVASLIKPQAMSEILAQMSADVAQRLTVELATKAERTAQGGSADLPKIEGAPIPQ